MCLLDNIVKLMIANGLCYLAPIVHGIFYSMFSVSILEVLKLPVICSGLGSMV